MEELNRLTKDSILDEEVFEEIFSQEDEIYKARLILALQDRALELGVKQKFKEYCTGCICPPDFPVCVCGRKPQGRLLTKKPIEPTAEEINENQRSRSAKLRVIIKNE